VSPLDPELFATVEECAAALLAGEPLAKYSPLEVADWLETLALDARRRLADAEARAGTAPAPAFRRLATDVAIQSGLGRFFAAKLLAGVLWALYERSGSAMASEEARKAYRSAREAWAELAKRAEGVYLKDITFGRVANLRGHWSDRLAAIDQNIADLEQHAAPRPDGVPVHEVARA